MSTPALKPIIFISYADADEPEMPADGDIKWLSFVTGHLRPAEEIGAFEIWTEPLVADGDLDPVVERKLRACDIFVPLVSPHSLAFETVVDRQIAIIRERQGRGEDVYLYPLLLTPTPETALDENLAAARRQTFFELRSRAAEPADAGRGRRDRGYRGRRGGVEEKAAVAIAAATANFAGPADFAAATGRQAARAEARDQRRRIA